MPHLLTLIDDLYGLELNVFDSCCNVLIEGPRVVRRSCICVYVSLHSQTLKVYLHMINHIFISVVHDVKN